jgi:hypothetical protein
MYNKNLVGVLYVKLIPVRWPDDFNHKKDREIF